VFLITADIKACLLGSGGAGSALGTSTACSEASEDAGSGAGADDCARAGEGAPWPPLAMHCWILFCFSCGVREVSLMIA